jgi:hypothetical protein
VEALPLKPIEIAGPAGVYAAFATASIKHHPLAHSSNKKVRAEGAKCKSHSQTGHMSVGLALAAAASGGGAQGLLRSHTTAATQRSSFRRAAARQLLRGQVAPS